MFLWVGVPSSSIFPLPQPFSIVPSSIAVTTSEAVFSPSLLQKTEAPFATAVALNYVHMPRGI